MTNHIHLVVDPGDKPESLSMLMKRVAGRQTRYVNRLEKRSGSLWEGRFKSSIVSTIDYLSACCRYIELNPLRAGMVIDPLEYKWSSYGCKTTSRNDPVVDYHRMYLALGSNKKERREMYAEYVLDTIPDYEIKLIREVLQRGQLTGGEGFCEEIARRTGIRFSSRGPGRPRNRETE